MVDVNALINSITLTAAAAGLIATQILKSKLIPIPFQNAPVPTAIVVSIVASYLALVSENYNFAWGNWTQAIGTVVVVLGVMVTVYENSIKNWAGVRSLEAPKQ